METMLEREYSSTDLRQHPRVRVPIPFTCSFSRLGMTKWLMRGSAGLGVVFDVSMKGARLVTESAIQPGDRMSISLRLPNQISPMNVDVATVRWEREHTFGLEFLSLSSAAEWRLRKFLSLIPKPAL